MKINKSGVSLMVSYVLLILIAVALSLLVFSYLKIYIPSNQKPECANDFSLIIQSLSCSLSTDSDVDEMTITLQNKGLFNADGVLIRIRNPDFKVKTDFEEEILFNPRLESNLNDCTKKKALSPGDECIHIIKRDFGENAYIVEIQAEEFIGEGNKIAVCEDSIVSQKVICS